MNTIAVPTRAVLDGVERIHFYEGENDNHCPEDITFPSVMRVVMEYLGENLGCKHHRPLDVSWGLGCAYSYFMGVSGMAFIMDWEPGFGGKTFALMDTLPGGRAEAFRTAMKAVGYGSEYLPKEAGEAAMREKIKASIAEHEHPVIGFGIIGPPEAAIITGYDQDGDTLIGWSFFQNDPSFGPVQLEPNGMFRKTGWYEATDGALLIGDKEARPAQEEVFLQALRRGLDILRTDQANGIATGQAAYAAWAADLRQEDFFPTGDEAILRARHGTHEFMIGQVAELRWYGAQWIIDTFEKVHFRLAEPLLRVAALWAGEHELMWQLWDLAGGIGNPNAWQEFAKPEVRARMIPVIEACQQKDAEAAQEIETALKKLV